MPDKSLVLLDDILENIVIKKSDISEIGIYYNVQTLSYNEYDTLTVSGRQGSIAGRTLREQLSEGV